MAMFLVVLLMEYISLSSYDLHKFWMKQSRIICILSHHEILVPIGLDVKVNLTRHWILKSIHSVGLKSLLHQGLSEPEFYGDLVYKFKKIRGMTDFSDQFRKIIMRYKRIGYNLNVMRQSACLVINPITVDGYATLFNCTPVDRASDSMMAPT